MSAIKSRARLTVERLEERDVPASIVSIYARDSYVADTIELVITGNDFNNQIDVFRETGQVKIIARGDTLLHYNPESTAEVSVTVTATSIIFNASGGVRSLSLNMGLGDDSVRISVIGDHLMDDLQVNMGDGNDSCVLLGSSWLYNRITNSTFALSAGNDSLSVYKTRLSAFNVFAGEGDDTVIVNDCQGNAAMNLESGKDLLLVSDCSHGFDSFVAALGDGDDRATFTGTNSFFPEGGEDGLTLYAGPGHDQIIFLGRTTVGKLHLELGDGNDDLFVDEPPTGDVTVSTLTVAGDAQISGGSGIDQVILGPVGNAKSVEFLGHTVIDLGEETDVLDLWTGVFGRFDAESLEWFGSLTILGGPGNDRVNCYESITVWNKLHIDLGVGNDSLSIYKARRPTAPPTLRVDGPDTETNVRIRGGEGNDTIRLGTGLASDTGNSVDFRGDTLLNMGSGNDMLIFCNGVFGRRDAIANRWYGGLSVLAGAGNDIVGFIGQAKVWNMLHVNLGTENDILFTEGEARYSVTLSVDGPDDQINVGILGGAGNDTVRFDHVYRNAKSVDFRGKIALDLGSGNDALFLRQASFGRLEALLGVGNDVVQLLDQVTVGSGSVLDGGAGTDQLPSPRPNIRNLTMRNFP
jgi:hypothetical protein